MKIDFKALLMALLSFGLVYPVMRTVGIIYAIFCVMVGMGYLFFVFRRERKSQK